MTSGDAAAVREMLAKEKDRLRRWRPETASSRNDPEHPDTFADWEEIGPLPQDPAEES